MPKQKDIKPGDPGPGNKALTPADRDRWNRFLRFVYGKGYSGNPVLDVRDKSIGRGLIQEFNAANPKDTLGADIVPMVQQEFQYFQKTGYFPGYDTSILSPFRGMLAGQVKNKTFSPVDSWFGSLTSTQAYPVAIDNSGKNYGTDYESFVKAMEDKYKNVKGLFHDKEIIIKNNQ